MLASLFLIWANPAVAAAPVEEAQAAAVELYAQGKPGAARRELAALLASPAARDPQVRLGLLEGLLDLCLQSLDMACVETHFPDYGETGGRIAPTLGELQRAQLVRKTLLYLDHLRLATGRPDQLRAILDRPEWRAEFPGDVPLYLRRQIVLSNALLQTGDFAGATRSVDRILSLVASLQNPEEGAFWTAHALVDAIGTLVHVGDSERAWGVYLATRDLIYLGTPAISPDAVQLRLVEARLLQERGQLPAAREALAAAEDTLARLDVEQGVRDWLAGEVLTLTSVVCTALTDQACARKALDAHPLDKVFARAQAPADLSALHYLAARALVASVEGAPDPVAAESLARPVSFETPGVPRAYAEIHRQAGLAVLQPAGAGRAQAVRAMARTLADYARTQRQNAFATGYRPGVVDQVLILLGLGQLDAAMTDEDQDAAFALFQLAGRIGPSFDADAQTRLGEAATAAERRGVHQALRLRARRDRLERQELTRTSARAVAAKPEGRPLRHDLARRARFREFARSLDDAQPVLGPAASLVSLRDLQAALRSGEAVIAFSPAGGGEAAYMCVRNDRVVQARQAIDPTQLQLDLKLLQAALTAGHAPSDDLDTQFPVAAAVRLNKALLAPVADCLKPGDHLIWLPAPAMVPVPVSILLPEAPPRLGQGWDLSQADWLVRRHAITYAVSASAFVAGRRGGRGAEWSFDFLGVGDPLLTGHTAGGTDRTKMVLRGARGASGLAALAPLPETRAELQQAAAGFPTARLLLGEAATERAFRRELIGSYRLLSFATHGLIRDEIAGLAEPALAFTPVSAEDPLDDGLLTASEIADLSLSARFVALSACNTADYDLAQFAADLPALASAFAVAGVPSTLATLWPVESETSRRVVASTFEQLGAAADLHPSDALAQAQRRFLATPPTRAHLHPRFWAPFIVLGDGATAPGQGGAGLKIVEAEQLTSGGGEVLSVRRTPRGAVARLIAEPEGGRFSSAVRLGGSDGEAWRRVDKAVGAADIVVAQGPVLVAGGYGPGPEGRTGAILEAFDARTGTLLRSWREEGARADALLAAALPLGDRGLFAVVDADLTAASPAGRAPAVRIYEVDAALAPRLLAEIAVPQIDGYPDVTLSRLGEDLLITLSERYPAGGGGPPSFDDFDTQVCSRAPVTWAELRDLRTGQLRTRAELPERAVASAVGWRDRFVIGGASQADCGTGWRAAVATLDRDLALEPWWTDASFGESEVRALAAAPDGTLVIGVQKTARFDHGPGGRMAGLNGEQRAQALVQLSQGPGRVSEPLAIAAGSHVFISDIDASRPDEILVGGGVGGEAAILRLRRTDVGR